ncbi:MAG TPA: hypothetical protein ENL03_00580, partial [Phycisphaerae bacterium]|nr:hypothetical protein [Phycisphaerae bacterium]
MMRILIVLTVCLCLTSLCVAQGDKTKPAEFADDSTLDAAKRYVEKSDKYLHHTKLARGMKGYGLTVMAGVEIVKFDAEIVSVAVSNGPHQDMILARLRGPGKEDYLTKTGIIAGMSGSPVYIKDPDDGKMKMIGAVAFGWFAQKEPIAGIQPITQMIAVSGVLDSKGSKGPVRRKGRRTGTSVGSSAEETKKFIARILSPDKAEFMKAPAGTPKPKVAGEKKMIPLSTPLTITGSSNRAIDQAEKLLGWRGLVPRMGGAVSPVDVKLAARAKLEPGSSFAIPLVTGDQNWSAVGTVTEVIGKRVLAFGHSFYSEGKVSYPMGPAYIHTVIANFDSFKMGVGLGVTGTLDRDEATAVSGLLGKGPATVPIEIKVRFGDIGRSQTFRYNLCKEKYFTPVLASILTSDAVFGWCNPPEQHNTRYKVSADFGKLGVYTASNVSNGDGAFDAVGDLTRPVHAMAENPFAQPLFPKSLKAEITILPGDIGLYMERVTVDGTEYKPGQRVTGKLTFSRFRKKRLTIAWKFDLPKDLPEGSHTIEIGDFYTQLYRMQIESPQLYDPKTSTELYESVKLIAIPQANVIY